MNVDDLNEGDIIYAVSQDFSAIYEVEKSEFANENVGVYIKLLEKGSGVHVEGIYETEEDTPDEEKLAEVFKSTDAKDIHSRFYVANGGTEDGVVVAYIKALESLGYEFSKDELKNIRSIMGY